MARQSVSPSPIGGASEAAASRRAARSPEYRQQHQERDSLRQIAWLLIKYRMDKGLTQQELAEKVGTSHSQISRIESGRHRTNLNTLVRIASALGIKVLVGFESTSESGQVTQDLVTL